MTEPNQSRLPSRRALREQGRLVPRSESEGPQRGSQSKGLATAANEQRGNTRAHPAPKGSTEPKRAARTWALWGALLTFALVAGIVAALVQHMVQERFAAQEASRTAFEAAEVSGRLGTIPTLTLRNPVQVPAQSSHRVITAGTGQELVEGDRIVLAVSTFNGQSGKQILPGAFPRVEVVEVSDAGLGPLLHPVLLGQRDGARILVLSAVEIDGQTYPELAVVDVLPRQLPVENAGQSAPTSIEGDLKSMVSFDQDSVPQLAPWGVATQIVKVEELVSGTGEQVASGDTVVVQYVVSGWDGSIHESTYTGLGPQEVVVSSLQPGLAEAVIDRAVGSRIVLAAPAALTDGNTDILAVVDILAISARSQ